MGHVVAKVAAGSGVPADHSNTGCERQKIQEMPSGSTFDNKPGRNETFQSANLAGCLFCFVHQTCQNAPLWLVFFLLVNLGILT